MIVACLCIIFTVETVKKLSAFCGIRSAITVCTMRLTGKCTVSRASWISLHRSYFRSTPRPFLSSFPTKSPKAFLISHMIATYPMPLDLMTSLYLVNNTCYDALRRLHLTSCYVGPVFCLPSLFLNTQSSVLTQSVLRHSVCSQTLSLSSDSLFSDTQPVLGHSVCSQTHILSSDTLFSDIQTVLRQPVCCQTASLLCPKRETSSKIVDAIIIIIIIISYVSPTVEFA
jgi:hypothetical protein